MSHHHSDIDPALRTIAVRYLLEDPHALTDTDRGAWDLKAAPGEDLLDVAHEAGINIEHSCGGVCACSTCHIYVEHGMDQISEPEEEEEDRVEEAPGLEINSRLACQCRVKGPSADGSPIIVRVPAWNRNAVKEVPH